MPRHVLYLPCQLPTSCQQLHRPCLSERCNQQGRDHGRHLRSSFLLQPAASQQLLRKRGAQDGGSSGSHRLRSVTGSRLDQAGKSLIG